MSKAISLCDPSHLLYGLFQILFTRNFIYNRGKVSTDEKIKDTVSVTSPYAEISQPCTHHRSFYNHQAILISILAI